MTYNINLLEGQQVIILGFEDFKKSVHILSRTASGLNAYMVQGVYFHENMQYLTGTIGTVVKSQYHDRFKIKDEYNNIISYYFTPGMVKLLSDGTRCSSNLERHHIVKNTAGNFTQNKI